MGFLHPDGRDGRSFDFLRGHFGRDPGNWGPAASFETDTKDTKCQVISGPQTVKPVGNPWIQS